MVAAMDRIEEFCAAVEAQAPRQGAGLGQTLERLDPSERRDLGALMELYAVEGFDAQGLAD